jgi:hypothetical protein
MTGYDGIMMSEYVTAAGCPSPSASARQAAERGERGKSNADMQESTTTNRCDVSYLVTKKNLAIDDISGKCIYQQNFSPMLGAKYFQWRKARYDGLAVGQKRDKGWWNAPDSQRQWQQWSKDQTN